MDDDRAVRRDHLPFGVVEVDAVAEQAARPEQPEAAIDIGVTRRLGKQLAHPGNFPARLGDMGLHVDTGMIGQQLPRPFELPWRGRGRKPRRHGVAEAIDAVPALDQRPRRLDSPVGRVPQCLGHVPIHQHLAGDQPHRAGARLVEQRIDGLGVHAAEDRRRRRAVAQQLVDELLRHHGRMVGVAEATLGGKGIALEPVEQPLAPGSNHLHLRIVQMGIDETGNDEVVGIGAQ